MVEKTRLFTRLLETPDRTADRGLEQKTGIINLGFHLFCEQRVEGREGAVRVEGERKEGREL